MALTYQSGQTYRDAFTYQGASNSGASVTPVTAAVAATAYNTYSPATPPVVTATKTKRGGMATVVSRKIETPTEREPYVPKVAPVSLRSQYDTLLEAGEIDTEEWAGLLMAHNVDPVPV